MAWVCHLCGDAVMDTDGALLNGPHLVFRPPKRWDPGLYLHAACVQAILQWEDMGCCAPAAGTLLDRIISQDSWSAYSLSGESNRCLACRKRRGVAEPCLRLDRGYERPYDQRWADLHLSCLRELVGAKPLAPDPLVPSLLPGFLDAMEQLKRVAFSSVS